MKKQQKIAAAGGKEVMGCGAMCLVEDIKIIV